VQQVEAKQQEAKARKVFTGMAVAVRNTQEALPQQEVVVLLEVVEEAAFMEVLLALL